MGKIELKTISKRSAKMLHHPEQAKQKCGQHLLNGEEGRIEKKMCFFLLVILYYINTMKYKIHGSATNSFAFHISLEAKKKKRNFFFSLQEQQNKKGE